MTPSEWLYLYTIAGAASFSLLIYLTSLKDNDHDPK